MLSQIGLTAFLVLATSFLIVSLEPGLRTKRIAGGFVLGSLVTLWVVAVAAIWA